MAGKPRLQPKAKYNQREQTIKGGQTNIAGDQHNHYSSPPDHSSTSIAQLFTMPLRSMAVALCVSIIVSIVVHFLGILVDVWPLTLSFSLSYGLSLTLYNNRVLEREDQRSKELERRSWHSLSVPDLDIILREAYWQYLQLYNTSTNGIPLTKQQHEQWLKVIADIPIILSLIKDKDGTHRPSEYDLIKPPTPPILPRILISLKQTLSYLLSVLLISSAALAGTMVPRATETVVIKLIDLLPMPSPTPTVTSEPTMTTQPLSTPTPTVGATLATIAPTATPTWTTNPTQLPTRATPTAERILAPTAIFTGTPASTILPTATTSISVDPAVPDLSATSATTVTITPRTALKPAAPTSIEATAISTPTATVEIGSLTGRIAYTVLSGDHYDTIVHDIVLNREVYRVSYARQPDLKSGGYLLVNKEGGGLERVDINRNDEREITERDEDARPHWAANDDRVVFESFEVDKNATILKLQVNTTLQSNPPYLHSPMGGTIHGRNAIFLEDGRIAFNACASWNAATSGDCGIWAINTDGSGVIRLSDQPHDYPSDNFKSQVLFTSSDRNNNWDVYITESPLQVRPLTTDPARDGLATASPTGDYIAFVSDRGGQWAVWVMHADGTGQRWLFDLDGTFGSGDRDWTNEKISWGP